MRTVEEIKEACLSKLTVSERAELARWLEEQDDEWDRQMEGDAESGKLDKLWSRARSDIEAGRVKPLESGGRFSVQEGMG